MNARGTDQPVTSIICSTGHALSRVQISRHGTDRYPTAEKQIKHLGTELLELAIAIGHAPGGYRTDPGIRREYADVGLSLYALGDKLGLDLIECMTELVDSDHRRFT